MGEAAEAVLARARSARPRPFLGLSYSGALSLAAIVAVLVVISVPRLQDIARQENEADARTTAQLLARALGSFPATGEPSMRDLVRRPELAGGLSDAELLQRGTLLRRHGYLFEVTRLAPSLNLPALPIALLAGAKDALKSMPAIRAWPWSHGSSGEMAFLVTAAGACLLHPNSASRWHGLGSAGMVVNELTGWRPVH
jgi:hypothetical protein